MKSFKFKLTAIILIAVIFFSIFFIGWNDYNTMDASIDMYPIYENAGEVELMLSEVALQIFNINKSIYLRLDISYLLLLITSIAGYKIIKHNILIHEILQYYFYSVFIACFINKKDGKKVYFISSY